MVFDTDRPTGPRGVGWLLGPDEELLVRTWFCQNPECTCDEAFLEAVRVADPVEDGDVVASLRVGPGGVLEGTGRSDVVDDLRALPRSLSDRALDARRQLHQDHAHRQAWRVPAEVLASNELVFYADYSTSARSIFGSGRAFESVEVDGVQYATDLAICPRPKCNCRKVRLVSGTLVERGSELVLGDGPEILLDLDGRPDWADSRGDRRLATRILAAWKARHADPVGYLRSCYREVRAAGERSVAPRRVPGTVGKRALPAKNAPCPCGSGRRYKFCCGRA